MVPVCLLFFVVVLHFFAPLFLCKGTVYSFLSLHDEILVVFFFIARKNILRLDVFYLSSDVRCNHAPVAFKKSIYVWKDLFKAKKNISFVPSVAVFFF